MIFILGLVLVSIFLVLITSELWWRKRAIHGEFSRKFVHITVGSFVAFWPFFLSWHEIQFLSIAFLIVVGVSKRLGVFQSIHSVQRPTWGEFFFAAAVGLVTLITHDKWIYMAALLQMSLADGLAAVVGVRFGRRSQYSVLGHTKSVAGSVTFCVVSFLLLVVLTHYGDVVVPIAALIALPFVAGIVENFGVQGLDNLLVPILIAAVLRSLS
jgi:phytol kinase